MCCAKSIKIDHFRRGFGGHESKSYAPPVGRESAGRCARRLIEFGLRGGWMIVRRATVKRELLQSG